MKGALITLLILAVAVSVFFWTAMAATKGARKPQPDLPTSLAQYRIAIKHAENDMATTVAILFALVLWALFLGLAEGGMLWIMAEKAKAAT